MTRTITRPLQTARRRVARAAALTAAVLSVAACFAANPATADARNVWIFTSTCDVFQAGTDANVHVRLEGTKATTPWLYLNTPAYNDFERNGNSHFNFPNLPDFGTIKSVVIKRDTWGVADGWCLDDVMVDEMTQSGSVDLGYYPWFDWVPAGSPGTRLYSTT